MIRPSVYYRFMKMKHGLLLMNLGTPDDSSLPAVRRYLREFLADPRVVTLPRLLRYVLLYGYILPFRSRKTAHAYQTIWTSNGSPLLYHSQNLRKKLATHLGQNVQVALGMRYGNPSLEDAVNELSGCETISLLPLYPQYSSAATGSSIEKILQLFSNQITIPSLNVISHFYAHPNFISASAELIKPHLDHHDHILFSYHGVPEDHLRKGGCDKICIGTCSSSITHHTPCYRAQCFQTTSLIAKVLGLSNHQHTSAFQSRLGKAKWITPYTDEILITLRAKGVAKLAISCPSFTADCLETLEEIGIRLKAQWQDLGGERLTLIPCLNDSDAWVSAIMNIAKLA